MNNRRSLAATLVIVFDAGSGACKRHGGAYGKKPDDARLPHNNPESPQFGNPVHCVRQIVPEAKTLGLDSAWDLIPTEDPAQRYLLVADGSNGTHPRARKRRAHRLLRLQRRRFPLGA